MIFPSVTPWTIIRRAGEGSRAALDTVWTLYRRPIYHYLRGRGLRHEDAEDLTQDVLCEITRDSILARARREKGRFRSLLLQITRNMARERFRAANAKKRGRPASLDAMPFEPAARDEPFDREWTSNLIQVALSRMSLECRGARGRYPRALLWFAVDGESYAEIARRLDATVANVKTILHRARGVFAKFFRDAILETCSSRPEYLEEVRYLLSFVPRRYGRPSSATPGCAASSIGSSTRRSARRGSRSGTR